MKTSFRLLGAGLSLALFGFCVFGFIATFEPLPVMQCWIWRTVYGLVEMACTIGLVRPLHCHWRMSCRERRCRQRI